jgi:hypothetical protein
VTADEIRALYIDTLARAAYMRRVPVNTSPPQWEDTDMGMPGVREHHRKTVGHFVDALAEAGLLPTGEHWQLRWRGELVGALYRSKSDALDSATEQGAGWTVAHTYTHDWTEVTQ